MHPNRIDRESDFINILKLSGYATTLSANSSDDIYVRSDGTVKTDYGALKVHASGGTLTAGTLTASGLHIQGPKESDEELTPYSYNVCAWSEDPEIVPVLFIAISPASITADVTGDVCEDVRYIKAGHTCGSMNVLNAEGVIATPTAFSQHGAGYEDRNTILGVAFICGLTNAAVGSHCNMRIATRRLISIEPRIIDTSKLG